MGDLPRLCQQAVEDAQRLGADETEAYAADSRSISVSIENNDVKLAESHEERGIGIRVFRKGGLGHAATNDLSVDAVAKAAEQAVAIASGTPSDPCNVLPEPQSIEPIAGLYDPAGESFGVEQALDSSLKMLATARDYDERVTVDSGMFEADIGGEAIATSKGIVASEQSSLFLYFIMGMARDGEEVSNFQFDFDAHRSVSEIDVEAVARRFAETVVSTLGAGQGETFTGSVILSPDAATDILGPIVSAVDANRVQNGMSLWAEHLGQQVASALLTVEDNGRLEGGVDTSSFDREGVPHRKLAIIENGRLANFLHNTYTAKKGDANLTGHADGGTGGPPGIGTTNVAIAPGNTSKDAMVAGIDKGMLVTRFSGSTDPISGDFSGAVKGGFLIEHGKIVRPVCQSMIAGNTFELLSQISALSSERKRLMSWLVPYVQLEGVSVTAG